MGSSLDDRDGAAAALGPSTSAAMPDRPPQAPGSAPRASGKRVVIIGGGFAGLACAQGLGGSDVSVTVVDRHNHNLFQPLLYQVATAALSPADIAEPIRKILRRFENVEVLMDEVTSVDVARRLVRLGSGAERSYDALVIATGSEYAYFGHDDWARHAPGLKSIDNARALRGKFLRAFERAELSTDPQEQEHLMTSVIIGGGPTGVEMAGAIAELGRWTLKGEFRHLDTRRAKIILVEGGERILGGFPENLSAYAQEQLQALGVTVLTRARVNEIRADGVVIGDTFVPAGTIVWGAGVTATPAARWLGIETDRSRRIPVGPDLRVQGFDDIFALGDLALLVQDGKPLPGLAQVAKQQGQHLGRSLRAHLLHGEALPPFRFHNRGNTAVIGRHAAIFDFGKHQLKGRLAWFLWALIHVYLLVSFEKRILVSLQWLWRYVTRARGARLIP